jgi:hypothetical protein
MIEPRLTAHRDMAPGTAGEALVEWIRDLEQETLARLRLMSYVELGFRPHPSANNADVTVWHLGRWFDVLASRRVGGPSTQAERWYRDGWAARTGYDPAGIGFLGLGTLTGYSTEEMLAVPNLGADALSSYLAGSVDDMVDVVETLSPEELHRPGAAGLPSPFQAVGSTVQGSFGHLGEIDCLVALHDRLRGGAQDTVRLNP